MYAYQFLKGQDGIPVFAGNAFPPDEQGIDGRSIETGCCIGICIGVNVQVGHTLVFFKSITGQPFHHAIDYEHEVVVVVFTDFPLFLTFQPFCHHAHIHSNDDLGSHFPDHIHGKIIDKSAINQYAPITFYGSESARN